MFRLCATALVGFLQVLRLPPTHKNWNPFIFLVQSFWFIVLCVYKACLAASGLTTFTVQCWSGRWSESGLGLGLNGWVRVWTYGLRLGLHLCGLELKRCGLELWSRGLGFGLGLGLHPGGLGLTVSPDKSGEKHARHTIQTFMCNNWQNEERN